MWPGEITFLLRVLVVLKEELSSVPNAQFSGLTADCDSSSKRFNILFLLPQPAVHVWRAQKHKKNNNRFLKELMKL